MKLLVTPEESRKLTRKVLERTKDNPMLEAEGLAAVRVSKVDVCVAGEWHNVFVVVDHEG